ncbi:AraC family transcriptional regulator [Paenibacillus sp. BAC0078]
MGACEDQPDLWKKEHTEMPEDLFPINVFHICFPDRSIIPPHWHDHLEWILITKGSFRVQVGPNSRELVEGELAFVGQPQIHAAYPTEDGSELYAIVFNEALLNGMRDHTEIQHIRPLLSGEIRLPEFYCADGPVTKPIRDCLERIVHSYQHKSFGYELCIKGDLFSSLGLAYPVAEFRPASSKAERRETGIQPVLIHLSNHFHQPLTVEEAARICCVTPNYFCHLFKKNTGKTLIEYVNMLRVHEACRLLQLRRHSIQEVAYRVGFSNLTYFGRIFKRITAMTPSDYVTHFS